MIQITQGQEAYLKHLIGDAANSRVMALLEVDDAGVVTVTEFGREVGQVVLGGFQPCDIELFDMDNGQKAIAFMSVTRPS